MSESQKLLNALRWIKKILDSAGNDTDQWLTLATDFDKSVIVDFHGIVLPLEPKNSLAAYKRHLNGEHQKQDIAVLEKNV